MKKYEFYSHRRSGHHAFIFWMINNLGGFSQAIGTRIFFNPVTGLYFYNDNTHYNYKLDKEHNTEIRNYEDCLPPPSPGKIVVIRDFLNTLSSRLNHQFLTTDLAEFINLWKEFARLAITSKDHTFVLYNRWLVDKSYRDEISEKIGIPNLHDNINYVNHNAGSSSFSANRREHDVNSYLTRYKQMNLNELQKSIILEDQELQKLNIDLFAIDIKQIIEEKEIVLIFE